MEETFIRKYKTIPRLCVRNPESKVPADLDIKILSQTFLNEKIFIKVNKKGYKDAQHLNIIKIV